MLLQPVYINGRPFVDVGLPTLIDASPPDPNRPPTNDADRYPAIIADARHVYGCTTIREVEDFWLEHCDRMGREPGWDSRPVVAYINRGQWLADCHSCRSPDGARPVSFHVWERHVHGMCLACCTISKVNFAAPKLRAAAIRLLAPREVVNRNWDAHRGETLDQLAAENRWLLDDPTVLKDGLWTPASVHIPDPDAAYVDVTDRVAAFGVRG